MTESTNLVNQSKDGMSENRQSEREERILNAAAELIIRYGYDKTTVDEIAQAAGVSKGTIYLHFKSKEDLFEALILRESDWVTLRFFERLDADPRGVTIFTVYLHGMLLLDKSPLLKAIYIRDRRILGDWVRHLRDTPAYGQAMSVTVEFIRHFQELGLLRRDLDPETVTYLLTALRYGILTIDNYLPSDQAAPSVADLSETLAEMLTSGLAPLTSESDQARARAALQEAMDVRLQFVEQRRRGKG